MFDWGAVGIEVGGRAGLNVKTTCPKCSETRHNKRDKCLSVNIREGVWRCHHCEWSGKAPLIGGMTMRTMFRPAKRQYRKPDYAAGVDPQDKLIAWFQGRGISEEVVRRNRIEARNVPMDGQDERAIAFPYLRDGEIVNVQYRTADKRFRLEANCELILYGYDDIQPGEPLLIVEGQIDKLSLEEAGYRNCVSVPNGCKIGDAEWLTGAKAKLDQASYFILAGDNDQGGEEMQAEMIRRLGPEKCWRATWPEGCKDANDVLTKHGKQALVEAVECAQPLPIAGVVSFEDLLPELERMYAKGIEPGADTSWPTLNKIYRPRLGEWTVMTGAPGMSKSTFGDNLWLDLAMRHDWRFAIFSPEQQPLERHAATLLELWAGLPFNPGPTTRMSWRDVMVGASEIGDYFKFLQPEEDDLSVDGILDLARACVTRYGIQGLVIDPWNEIEHSRPAHMTETEYIGDSLRRIRHFARLYKLHIWIIVHPTKLQKNGDGQYPVATPYDCAGSAHWFNKSDMVLSLWRDKTQDGAPLEIHSQKVRFRENGSLGTAQLWFDAVTGKYTEQPNYVCSYASYGDDDGR